MTFLVGNIVTACIMPVTPHLQAGGIGYLDFLPCLGQQAGLFVPFENDNVACHLICNNQKITRWVQREIPRMVTVGGLMPDERELAAALVNGENGNGIFSVQAIGGVEKQAVRRDMDVGAAVQFPLFRVGKYPLQAVQFSVVILEY